MVISVAVKRTPIAWDLGSQVPPTSSRACKKQPLQTGPLQGSIKVFPLCISQVTALTSAEIFLLISQVSKETGLGWHTPKCNVLVKLSSFCPATATDKWCVPTLSPYPGAQAGSRRKRSDGVPRTLCRRHPSAHLGIQLPHCKVRTTTVGCKDKTAHTLCLVPLWQNDWFGAICKGFR